MDSSARYGCMIAAFLGMLIASGTAQAANIVVNTRADVVAAADGRCSLREAITASNLNVASGAVAGECAAGSVAPLPDRIGFSTRGRFRPTAVNGQLPALTDGYAMIDGWSAPAAVAGGKPRIVLDGSLLVPPYEIGIYILSSFNVVRGLAIGSFGDFGIFLETADAHDNWILDNRIGTTRTGRQARPNSVGVVIQAGAVDNLVGTNGDGVIDQWEGNLVSGNTGDGFGVGGTGNRISGNRIGTTFGGGAALANGVNGIVLQVDSAGLVVGTDGDGSPGDALEGNLISGNTMMGIVVGGLGGHVVAGNLIGLNSIGTAAVPNQYGIEVALGTNDVRFGTDGDGVSDDLERNVISGNTLVAMNLYGSNHAVAGNYIGTDISGTFAIPNPTGISIALEPGLGNGGTVIGGIDERFRNVISGNTGTALNVGTVNETVQCNFIGTDVTGTLNLANGLGVNGLGTSNALVRSNRISFNTTGVYVSAPAVAVENNIISGNASGLSWSVAGTLDAEDNWWGDATGPTDAGNPGGIGDPVYALSPMGGVVDYDPWLVAEPVLCQP